MVFKPFTNFARQKLVKSFTHGYAQTVVAASQSSYAASTNAFPFTQHGIARYGKSGTPQLHNAFQSSSGSSGAGTKAGSSSSSQNDSGLAAYYAAWQQANNGDGDSEWKQFQFSKRIGWRGPPVLRETVDKSNIVTSKVTYEATDGDVVQRVRSNSTSAVDALKTSEVAKGGIQAEVSPRVALTPAAEVEEQATKEESDATLSTRSNILTPDPSPSEFSSTDLTTATSVSDPRSQAFLDHIEELHVTGKHAEVPAVFEALLLADGKPTTSAYNALLTAAVRVPATTHQAVQKALSVHSDMHRRGVSPDTATYSTLIDLLASRALDVAQAKNALAERRARYQKLAGKGLFAASHDVEAAVLAEDDTSSLALRLFESFARTPQLPALPVSTYELLTAVCAEFGKPTNMIAIYAHMESQHVAPSTDIFTAMIPGFARNGDLISAVECYNEYKSLAVAADAGQFDLVNRADHRVYTALMKAYVLCGKSHGAARFFDKIRETVTGEQMAVLEDMAVPEAFVEELLKLGQVEEASSWLHSTSLSAAASTRAWSRIAIAAADKGAAGPAVHAFEQLPVSSSASLESAAALLAMHMRLGDVPSATTYWEILNATPHPWSSALVEPTTMYAAGLLDHNHPEALAIARQAYARIRSAAVTPQERASAVEAIDAAIESLGQYMKEAGIVPSAGSSMDLLRSMIDNGGLVPPVSMQILNGLGADALRQLGNDDIILLTQIQGSLILGQAAQADIPSLARFAILVEAIMSVGMPLDERMASLVEKTLQRMAQDGGRPDLLFQWHNFLQRGTDAFPSPTYTRSVVSPVSPVDQSNSFDPHGASTDHRGSSIVAEILDKKDRFGGSRLKEALMTFRNVRRGGRHPRYATYAKLISAAARERKQDLTHELLALAKTDVPYLAQYPAVLQGWTTILDSMISACLTLGDRPAALRYHEELSAIGGAPSANTFGLYITTLKESTKTFDEATEAVKIFHRAKAEGIEPTSFLYNALIGKLGKARRIDDTLYYFGEMRNLGIQPTSVTYGTVVNALCRVSDERHAEELFDEMESMPNYKPRPAPYNSLMQFYLTTKRDRSKVLALYDRMVSKNIAPASHTFKLLIDAYAIEPVDMRSAEAVLDQIRQAGLKIESVHYAALIHARGCMVRDMEGTRRLFDEVLADTSIVPQACVYQAFLEAMVANHQVAQTPDVLVDMKRRGVAMTAYIANTLIHGWALEGNIDMAKSIYATVGVSKREPSTYEAMTRAFLAVEDTAGAMNVVQELSRRGYPPAVADKVYHLLNPRTKSTSDVMSQTA
ncbi:MAG: hypothetical protein M1823_001939 [Watsoniomyces obsoletus]|nr:MAG: hypothetical protein M1823_001939 [Watsoniomyces obsoletus]